MAVRTIGRCRYPLTYEKPASYDFDANAEYLYALELLPELGGQ